MTFLHFFGLFWLSSSPVRHFSIFFFLQKASLLCCRKVKIFPGRSAFLGLTAWIRVLIFCKQKNILQMSPSVLDTTTCIRVTQKIGLFQNENFCGFDFKFSFCIHILAKIKSFSHLTFFIRGLFQYEKPYYLVQFWQKAS